MFKKNCGRTSKSPIGNEDTILGRTSFTYEDKTTVWCMERNRRLVLYLNSWLVRLLAPHWCVLLKIIILLSFALVAKLPAGMWCCGGKYGQDGTMDTRLRSWHRGCGGNMDWTGRRTQLTCWRHGHIPFTIRDRGIKVNGWSPAPGSVSTSGTRLWKGTWTRKLKFGFLKIQKLVGLEVVWYVIG